MLRWMLAMGLVTTTMACATTASSRFDSATPAYKHDLVTFDELSRASSTTSNLYQALERIRPTFVRPRMSGQALRSPASSIDVFINGGYAGDGNVLLTLNPAHIASVRLERRSQAYVKHGAWLRGENVLYVTLLR